MAAAGTFDYSDALLEAEQRGYDQGRADTRRSHKERGELAREKTQQEYYRAYGAAARASSKGPTRTSSTPRTATKAPTRARTSSATSSRRRRPSVAAPTPQTFTGGSTMAPAQGRGIIMLLIVLSGLGAIANDVLHEKPGTSSGGDAWPRVPASPGNPTPLQNPTAPIVPGQGPPAKLSGPGSWEQIGGRWEWIPNLSSARLASSSPSTYQPSGGASSTNGGVLPLGEYTVRAPSHLRSLGGVFIVGTLALIANEFVPMLGVLIAFGLFALVLFQLFGRGGGASATTARATIYDRISAGVLGAQA